MSERQKAIDKFLKASKLMKSSDYEEALNLFKEVEQQLDSVPALFYNVSIIYTELADWSKAQDSISKALKLDPNNIKYLRHQFKVTQKMGNYSSAIDIADIIIQHQYIPEVLINKAFLHLRRDEIQTSVDIFEEMLKQGAHNPTIYFTLGILKYQSQQYTEAEKLIREAIKQDYQTEQAQEVMVAILKQNDKADEAIEILEAIHSPNDSQTYNLAKLYKQTDELGKSLQMVEHLLETNPTDEYRTFHGHVLREMGKFKEAIGIYNEILASDDEHLSAIKGKALALVELGQYDEANALFERGENINRGGEMPNFDNLIQNLDVID